jgi:chromosome segregation ATPase
MKFKLDKLEQRLQERNIAVEGCELEIEFELSELPAIIKEVPTVISSFSNAAEKSNSREWDKLCNEANEAKDKLFETERNLRGAEARAEAAERRAERLKEEKAELKARLNETPEKPDIFRELRSDK